jgi:putative oxidoreductase
MKKKVEWGLCILLALLYLNAGLNKVFMYMPPPADLPEPMVRLMEAFNTIGWLMPLVAFAEIVGGILILIPRFRALGMLVLFPILVGIFLTHLIQVPAGLPIAIAMLGIQGWLMINHKEKLLPLIR